MRNRNKKVAFGLCVFFLGLVLEAQAQRRPFALCLRSGMGFERETGRSWAVEPSLGLEASRGRDYAYADAAAAGGRLDWRETLGFRALDSASFGFGHSLIERPRALAKAEAQLRYRSFGDSGGECSASGLLGLSLGAVARPRGLMFRAAGGYSFLVSRYEHQASDEYDWGPILLLGVCAKAGPRFIADFAVTDYTGSDSGIFCKIFYSLGASYKFNRASLDARFTLKYSDFFTLTSYADGFAFRALVRIPLFSREAERSAGLW
jgi:hypothetical protein